jgi:hypothetical protein
MCLLKLVLNCEQDFSYLSVDYLTSGLTITGLGRIYCNVEQILFIYIIFAHHSSQGNAVENFTGHILTAQCPVRL